MVRVIGITLIGYFVALTALCWFLDLAFPGKHQAQARYGMFFHAGVVSGTLALVSSVVLRRSDRRIARLGFYSCLLWMIWALLPRL